MDIQSFTVFITGGSLVASLVTGIIKKGLSSINSRWGSLVTQIVLFVVSLIIAVLFTASTLIPTSWLLNASLVFSGAIVLYEVFYKAIYQQLILGNT